MGRRRRLFVWMSLLVPCVLLVLASFAGWRLLDGPTSEARQQSRSPVTPAARTAVTVGDAGDLHVVMLVSFGEPRAGITLEVPRRSGADFTPSVEILSLDADGREIVAEWVLGAGESVLVPLDAPSARVRLAYVADGTYVAAGKPSPAGRGLVLLTPLIIAEVDLPAPVEVSDARILNLACSGAAGVRVCGNNAGKTWTAERVADEDVVAQIDLVGP